MELEDLKTEGKYQLNRITEFLDEISTIDRDELIFILNEIKKKMHSISPFKNEPVDCVLWVKSDNIIANDYNPNKVAPPEMELLETSIINDGYTQPIVTWPKGNYIEVIDGFHRNRVGKESKIVSDRIMGYLPTVVIRKQQEDKNDRIASTIRHNRARGKHQIDAMSEIVLELKNRNWTNARISKQLGMDEDEILRLCQITGLKELFIDDDFSRSWNAEDSEIEYEDLTDEIDEKEKLELDFRTVNTSDPNRFFHTYDEWECYKAGFYETKFDGKTDDECKKMYAEFLSDERRFRNALENVIIDWKNSCEHYLTNSAMNRIAWLGQASMCYETGIPSKYSSGFYLLSKKEQDKANRIALEYLNKWLESYKLNPVSLNDALSLGRQVNIY
jgi:ParB-like chromosome segregation protein Spo0J